ncbi:MAG: anaerobic ribonucleoside-triphosphate reductase activating protein [Desulfuromonadaceae bacterium]
MLNIGGLTRCTTIDYPGELAAVIFCQGCPWRCGYCHNTHLMPQQSGTPIKWGEAIGFLESRRGLLDAVVFSGGEPTMQAGLHGAMLAVKKLGFKIGLHTAGAYPEVLEKALPFAEWVGMDLKAPFEEYERVTGIPGSGEAAGRSAELVRRSGVLHQFRTTLAPYLQQNGRIEALQQMVAAWGDELVLQRMNPIPVD